MFRERLCEAGAIQKLFDAFDRQLRDNGYLAMGRQLVDATLVQAPRQRNTAEEKAAIKAGKPAGEIWPDKPAKARQKDVEARWTVKTSRVREGLDGKPLAVLAIPVFGYKNLIVIDRRYGFVRAFKATDAARHDGAVLREIVSRDNTASDVWADTAYRSKANEAWLRKMGRVSRIHQKKPKGRPMPARLARANAAKSRVRARVEHVFAQQKDRMGLFVRTAPSSAPKPESASPTLPTISSATSSTNEGPLGPYDPAQALTKAARAQAPKSAANGCPAREAARPKPDGTPRPDDGRKSRG